MPTARQAEIPSAARRTLRRALLASGAPTQQNPSPMTLRHAFACLPDATLAAITAFPHDPRGPGMMRVRRLPVDPHLPSTPTDGRPSREKTTFLAEAVLLGLTHLVGSPMSVATEKQGRVIHDVVPVASGAKTQTNQGSRVALRFHSDIVFDESRRYDDARPDVLVLLCLREDRCHEARTVYADARDVVARLSREAVTTLRQPEFQLNAPGGYVRDYAGGRQVLSVPVPLLRMSRDRVELCLAANGIHPLSSRAEAVLTEVNRVCRSVSTEVRLAPGDALLLDNRKGVHGRSAFDARYDGRDRWLQRTYVRVHEDAGPTPP